jgi:beta-1,4-mannosyl-glycoprotein beta-1,4-N-acetylglucosaminyltransferase
MIYDTFTFWNELDLLEIRLNILAPYVDKFVICEGQETFAGNPKPLNFQENRKRFEKWLDKIVYIVPQNIDTSDPFQRAAYQKDYVRDYLHIKAKDNDIIYFGDLDEIWKPQEITDDKVYNLQQLNYSYYLNNRSSEAWVGTVVGKWKTFKKFSVNYWRANHTNELPNGGWHFTNIGGLDQILKKIESYDHCNEVNCAWVRDNLKTRIENGEDYLGRGNDWQGKPFKMWTDETELPQCLLENKEKYKHLWK